MKTANIQHNINLRPFNTFGIHAHSRFFAVIQQVEDFLVLLQDPQVQNQPKFILGGGSNILFTRDYPGLIIKNEIKGIEKIAEDDAHVFLKIGAGEIWHELVLDCVQRGYGGIENLSLIPGTVGAAPIQNIGAYGTELGDVFHELTAIDLASGEVKIFNREQCQFGYRESVFKSIFKNRYLIASVTLCLDKTPKFNLSYGALQSALDEMKISQLTLRAVSDAVISIRRSKLPDPSVLGNAGSFFKNPIISQQQFATLQASFPQIPYFAAESVDSVKISAGWLIEQCGWKGKRLGDVGVYEKQALVIVNFGGGTGAAIQDLIQQIQTSVRQRFDIELLPEVNII